MEQNTPSTPLSDAQLREMYVNFALSHYAHLNTDNDRLLRLLERDFRTYRSILLDSNDSNDELTLEIAAFFEHHVYNISKIR